MVSTARFAVKDGHAYALPALSDYFAAVCQIDNGASIEGAVCLPIRKFNRPALVTARGTSVFAEMFRFLDYLVIEDVDLRPSDLVDHPRRFQLTGLAVLDLTAEMGLVGNYAYLLWSNIKSPPPIAGDQLA